MVEFSAELVGWIAAMDTDSGMIPFVFFLFTVGGVGFEDEVDSVICPVFVDWPSRTFPKIEGAFSKIVVFLLPTWKADIFKGGGSIGCGGGVSSRPRTLLYSILEILWESLPDELEPELTVITLLAISAWFLFGGCGGGRSPCF